MRRLLAMSFALCLASCAGDDPLEETEDTGGVLEGGADDTGAAFDSSVEDTGEIDTGSESDGGAEVMDATETDASPDAKADAATDSKTDAATDAKTDASSDTRPDAPDAISLDVLPG